jgi:hypothetical protein
VCGEPINPNFSDAEHLENLLRFRKTIAAGKKEEHFDDTTPGNKSTHCSWGMCSETPADWPEDRQHIWPQSHAQHGRVAPRSLQKEQRCPFDNDPNHQGPWGCFYRCRIFQASKKAPKPTREEAIKLYDQEIEKTQKRILSTTTPQTPPIL